MSEPGDVWARRDYTRYAGPVAQAFEHCQDDVAVIIGPTGGGKSTAAARRILRVAQWQHVSPRDGLRKCRIGVVAPTYRRLWDQVIPSYLKEINPAWGIEGPGGKRGFSGAKGDPAQHDFLLNPNDGKGMCQVQVLFRAVGDNDLEEFFRGFEVTAWWLPEMDTHASGDILSLASNRVGRYPEPDDRPDNPAEVAYAGVWGDANAPEIDDWFFNRFWLPGGRKPGDRVFIQPSGLDPRHENAVNLKKINPRYYPAMAARLDPWAARRLVENKPGYSRHGAPVHEHFDLLRMVTEHSIPPERGFALHIGADCGNTLAPAATFNQEVYQQLRALAEVMSMGQMDLLEFAYQIRQTRETKFSMVSDAFIYADPSARAKSVLNRDTSLAALLQHETGIEVILAPSNDPLARRTALDQYMKRNTLAGPGFVASGPDCPGLIKALAGGYRFAKKGDKQTPTPSKDHPWSDIAESEQYAALAIGGLGSAVRGVIHDPRGWADSASLRPILQD